MRITQPLLRFVLTVLSIAGVTFGGLTLIQHTYKTDTIQGGLINPDATIQQVKQELTPVFVVSGNVVSGGVGGEVVTGGELDDMIQDLISDENTMVHQAATSDYRTQLDRLCTTYRDTCAITVLDGEYSSKQEFAYQLMVVYLVQKLEDFGFDPLVSLRHLTVNNYTKNKRGYANAKLMVLNTYQMANNKEFLQVLAHEMGHVVDLGVIVGTSRQVNPDYTEFGKAKFRVDDQSLPFYAISWVNEDTMRARMSQTDFVSGYGMTNPFEDFAECHNMYLYHREVFAYLAATSPVLQRKYDYFNTLYQSQYLSVNFNPTDLTTLDTEIRPWDTTRM